MTRPAPGLLARRLARLDLAQVLLPRPAYRPFPPAQHRSAWEALPAELRAAQIAGGEQHLGCAWPPLPATFFMEFVRTGDRSHFEALSFDRRRALAALVVAECMQGQGRFLDDITNGIWAICEESFWGVPAHNAAPGRGREALPDVTAPIIDLFAGETAGLLAWTDYLLRPALDAITPLVCRRLRQEVRRRLLEPFLARDDFWWMGLQGGHRVSNWNPWCTSNCLAAALLLEPDQERRLQAVAKSLRLLDRFLATYSPDGGCDEGTSYWTRAGASLFDCLDLLHGASAGRIDLSAEPLVGEIGRFLYRCHISGDYYINFADGAARLHIPADLVYRFGRRLQDPHLAALGAAAHRASSRSPQLADPLPRRLPAIFNYRELTAAEGDPPYLRDVWLPGIQVMAAREQAGSSRGLYLAAKGGHNGEQHNHNDVGQFLVYLDGCPLLVDPGVETYTAQTFSSHRYELWTMQSAYHNLPTVNGHQQPAGEQFRAAKVSCRATDELAELAMDLAPAYPPQAGITSWVRTLRLHRQPAQVEISDEFALAAATSQLTLSLLTPCPPQLVAPGTILLGGEPGARLHYQPAHLAAAVETIELQDGRLRQVWGERLYRLLLQARKSVRRGCWRLQVMPR